MSKTFQLKEKREGPNTYEAENACKWLCHVNPRWIRYIHDDDNE